MSRLNPSRLASLLITIVWVSVLLAGCGTGAGSAGSVLQVWYGTDDPVERVWSQHLARQYQSTHPNVHVNLQDFSFEDLNTKLQLALSSGNPPDVAYTTPRGPGIPAYVGAHRLLDLTSAAEKRRWSAFLRQGLLAEYNQPFSYMGSRRGSIVAVPTELAAVAVMVNEALLRRLHLQIPHTLAALERALPAARAAGYTPLGLGNADGWLGDDWYLTLVNALASPSTLEREQRLDPTFSFQQPVFKRAATILQRWARDGYFTQDFGGLEAQEGIDQFFHGKTLFQLISSSENPQITHDQKQTGIPIGVFAFPRAGGGGVVPLSGYEGWVVPAASKHTGQALNFISSLLAPQTAHFLLRQNVVPSQESVTPRTAPTRWLRQYLSALDSARPGLYIDAAPVPNLNATMEANVQLLLQGYETPAFLPRSLQEVYASRGRHGGSTARIDGEF